LEQIVCSLIFVKISTKYGNNSKEIKNKILGVLCLVDRIDGLHVGNTFRSPMVLVGTSRVGHIFFIGVGLDLIVIDLNLYKKILQKFLQDFLCDYFVDLLQILFQLQWRRSKSC
jgi:hypothetical protein